MKHANRIEPAPAPPAARRILRIALLSLFLPPILFLSLSCRKEKPATEPAAAQKEVTTAPATEGPSFRDSAEPGAALYSGLKNPRGAALDPRGRLWVADFGNSTIRVFDASGGYLGGWGGRGDGPHNLKDPCGVAIDGDDVYVADTWNGRIARFNLRGESKGRTATELGLYSPRGVTAAPGGGVWVADSGNHRVLRLERDLTNPRVFGRKGTGPEEFVAPTGIAVGPSGNVYVADAGNQRVQVLDSEGRFKGRFGFPSWKPNVEPYIEVDDDETLYITDSLTHIVVAMDSRGKERRRWTADDSGARLLRPTGLALDRKKRILYVVNTDGDSVGKIRLSGKAAE